MSNEYKQTLARFEQAVRDHALIGSKRPIERDEIIEEYKKSKRALVQKLTYRTGPREINILARMVIDEMSDPSPELAERLIRYSK
jgi:hypothetical protein